MSEAYKKTKKERERVSEAYKKTKRKVRKEINDATIRQGLEN